MQKPEAQKSSIINMRTGILLVLDSGAKYLLYILLPPSSERCFGKTKFFDPVFEFK
jgi:hypothetical protein